MGAPVEVACSRAHTDVGSYQGGERNLPRALSMQLEADPWSEQIDRLKDDVADRLARGWIPSWLGPLTRDETCAGSVEARNPLFLRLAAQVSPQELFLTALWFTGQLQPVLFQTRIGRRVWNEKANLERDLLDGYKHRFDRRSFERLSDRAVRPAETSMAQSQRRAATTAWSAIRHIHAAAVSQDEVVHGDRIQRAIDVVIFGVTQHQWYARHPRSQSGCVSARSAVSREFRQTFYSSPEYQCGYLAGWQVVCAKLSTMGPASR